MKQQHPVDGILLLDKPLQMTSNRALQVVKRLFGAKKAGHTGSLDPLATGMLPICFGEATKFSQFLLESDKSYEVEATLGVKTTTGDAEGEVIATRSVPLFDVSQLEKVVRPFEGNIEQIPPMFSAIKQQGKPLYELARQGIEVPRAPRPVTIYSLKIKSISSHTIGLTVHCSKGTYIRTLVEDIGEALGCGAHVSALRRTTIVPYQQGTLLTLKALESLCEKEGLTTLRRFLLPIETAVQGFAAVTLSASALFYLKMGQAVRALLPPAQKWVRLYTDKGVFMGVGEVLEDGRVAPKRLINLNFLKT